jgi:hypothetical protein
MLIKINNLSIAKDFFKQVFLINENILETIENVHKAEVFVDNIENPKGFLSIGFLWNMIEAVPWDIQF